MSLKEARRIVKRLRRESRRGTIRLDVAACKLHDPNRHPMSGAYTVIECFWNGAGEAARYIWK